MTQQNSNPAHTHAAAEWTIETQLVHGGRSTQSQKQGRGAPTIQPIHASTTYVHESVEALDRAFSGTTSEGEAAFVYARHGNPNTSAFEEAVARAEKGVGAVSCSSGMAAIHIALVSAGLTTGAKIVASKDLYGPTITLLQKQFVPIGIELILTDICQPEAIALIRDEEPDIIFIETVSNPLVKVADLDAISQVAREIGAVSIVDSTFSTPYLLRPLEHGFDLVVHSATKYISGHGDSTGGIVVSARNALLDQLRTNSILLGAVLSPFEAHLMLRGLRTLALRVERQCTNAIRVAQFLQHHPAVAKVNFPGLPEHPQHDIATRLMSNEQYGALLSFELKEQSREAVFRFMNRLELCLPVTTLGDVFTLVSYPPISSHRTQSAAELQAMGISEGLVRLSVGIENVADILRDLEQALAAE